MKQLDRREFIKQTVITTSTLAAGGAWAGSDLSDLAKYDFLMARVRFKTDLPVYDQWDTWPIGDANLLEEFRKVVRCKIKPVRTQPWPREPKGREDQFNAVIDFRDPYENYMNYPFAMMTSEGAFKFDQTQRDNLKKYLQSGAFLLMDDCISSDGGDFFYKSCFRELEQIFGQGAVVRIPKDHEIYHNVYDMGDEGLPYINHGQKYGGRGVFIDDRLAVLLSPHDLHCGWTKPDWLDQAGYERTIQMGINILMYAMSH